MLKLFCFNVKLVESKILSTNPEISIPIFTKFSNCLSAKPIAAAVGVVLLEQRVLGRQVVYASEVSSNPNTSIPILKYGVNGVARNGIFVAEMLAVVATCSFNLL